jgi:hypothetical protein
VEVGRSVRVSPCVRDEVCARVRARGNGQACLCVCVCVRGSVLVRVGAHLCVHGGSQ